MAERKVAVILCGDGFAGGHDGWWRTIWRSAGTSGATGRSSAARSAAAARADARPGRTARGRYRQPDRAGSSGAGDLGLCRRARVKARENRPGHPAPSPRLLLALWLYATSDGVGSARALDRLCDSHDVYRWLCGGVSLNYHTLSDFRVGCADLLDRLLSEHLAALSKAGLVDLEKLAQDGVRIRANAGTGSFRREATLDRQMAQAKAVVEELKREVDADPEASNRRIRAARERAARERSERVQAAQTALAELKRKRKQLDDKGGNGKKPKEPRASTTDPQARVMKMADAGFRPAYNVQVASAAGQPIVVAVDVDNNGSDRGLMRPMLERTRARLKRFPRRHLVDGGFCSAEDIEWAHGQGIRSIVHRPNPGAASILSCRGAAMARGYWPGAPAWPVTPARHSTRPARSANASMPAGATGTSGN